MFEDYLMRSNKKEEVYFPEPCRPYNNDILPSVSSDSLFFLSVRLEFGGTQSQLMRTIERVLSNISDLVRRVSPHGFYIYVISKNGIVSMLRYSVYAIRDSTSFLITTDKVRTYDYGGDICCSKFHEFQDVLSKEEGLKVDAEVLESSSPSSLFCSLRPSLSVDLPSIDDSTIKVEDCFINIMSQYWEKKRHGYSTLILLLQQKPSYSREYPFISNIFIENVIGKDLVIKEDGDSEMTLLAVLCLQQILSVYGYNKEVYTITSDLLQKVKKTLEGVSQPSSSLSFDHGIISRKRAEMIVGSDMPGRYLLYQDEEDNVKKIIVYQCVFLGDKHFKVYEVFFKDDGVSLSCGGEDFSDVWHLLSTMIVDSPILYRSDVYVLIENLIQRY